jgi:hypothetical protein
MRVAARRTADRQQLAFDWNAAAVPATVERGNELVGVECEEANGHETQDSTGRPSILLGEAQSSEAAASGCAIASSIGPMFPGLV